MLKSGLSERFEDDALFAFPCLVICMRQDYGGCYFPRESLLDQVPDDSRRSCHGDFDCHPPPQSGADLDISCLSELRSSRVHKAVQAVQGRPPLPDIITTYKRYGPVIAQLVVLLAI